MIVKYAKPLPYFMKYASPYYMTLSSWNKTYTNMNKMCFDIEKWQKKTCFSRAKSFDYSILIDESVEYTEEEFNAIENIYLLYSKEMKELRYDQYKMKHYDNYKWYIREEYGFSKKEARQFMFDWDYYKNKVKQECMAIVPDQKKLANIVVKICYEKYKARKKNFMWVVAQEGILSNLKSEIIELPKLDSEGEHDILGKKYTMTKFLYIDEGCLEYDKRSDDCGGFIEW